MNNEIEELSQTIVEIYNKNIIFLKNNFSSLYNDIETLSNDILTGKTKETYTLEYIDGYFDILNQNEDGGYFYNTNSFKDADARAEVVTFDTQSSLALLRNNPNTNKLLSDPIYKDVVPIIAHLNDVVDFKNIKFEKIFKCIHIGTGLGIHIQEIQKKLDSLTTLIIEDDLEIFRLSLFITDYSIFQDKRKKLFLAIGNNKLTRLQILRDFSDHHKYMNYNVKYTKLLATDDKTKDEIINFYASYNVASFPYKFILENMERLIGFVNDGNRFLNVPKMFEKSILRDKKVLIIGAGPSLDGYIEWISKHQDKFIIVATDVILRKLEQYKIIPQIVVSIDPSNLCAVYLTTKDPNYLDNTGILLLSQQSQRVLEVLKGKNYYFSQVLDLIPEIGHLGSAPNVGTFSFSLSVYLGANEIYLIGIDAAFNQETGGRYSNGASIGQKNFSIEKKDLDGTVSLDGVIEVKGNLRETVITNRVLYNFKDNFEEVIHSIEKLGIKIEAFNLSDGAYIEGFIPIRKQDMDEKVKNFQNETCNIINELDEVSTFINEIKNRRVDIEIITSIITRIKKFEKIKIISKDKFLETKLDTMIWILERSKMLHSPVYGTIFLEYTSLVDIYINFLLNLKQKNIHSKEELSKISKMWSQGSLIMFKEIKNALQQDTKKKPYGVVEHDFFTFRGFCKEIDSDKICDVDVYMDGKIIDTISANKHIEQIERKHNIKGHGFEFELDDKYLDKSHYLTFQAKEKGQEFKNYKIQIPGKNNIEFTEYLFGNSLNKPIDKLKIENMYSKNSIGFLAVEENIKDENFISYIKELHVRFPNAAFKAFYFNDNQKTFLESHFENLIYISPKNIYEVLNEIEIFIFTADSVARFSELSNIFTYYCKKIYAINYNSGLLKMKVGMSNIDLEHNYYLDEKLFSIDEKKLSKGNVEKLLYNNLFNLLKLDRVLQDADNLYELYFYDRIDLILSSDLAKNKLIDCYIK